MKFIKENKVKIILGVIALMTIFFIVFVVNLIFPNDSKDLYGNRLSDMPKYYVDQKLYNEIKEKVELKESIDKVIINTSGRIINFVITLKEDLKMEETEKIGEEIIKFFDLDEQKYYDFQIFIDEVENSEIYPTIGYKHHTSDKIVWANNSVQVVE